MSNLPLLPLLAITVTLAACEKKTSSDGSGGSQSVGGSFSGATSSGGSAGANGGAGGTPSGGAGAPGGTAGQTGAGAASGGQAGAAGGVAGQGSGGAAGRAGAPGRTGPLRILPIGDSITGSTCYPARLWQKLRQSGRTDFDFVGTLNSGQSCGVVGYDDDNEGHGGYLVTNLANAMRGELQTWTAANAYDVALVHFGTNDVWNNIAASNILNAYGVVVDELRARNARVVVLLAKIIPMAPDATTCTPTPCPCSECPGRVVTLNDAIPAWAQGKSTAASPVIVVDTWTGFDVMADTRDRVHPNDGGSQKIADRFFDALVPLF